MNYQVLAFKNAHPMEDLQSLFKLFLSVLEHRRVITYIDVASACLFVYDFLLNIDIEIKYIYTFRWGHFEVLYAFQRFLPFLDMCISFLHLDFVKGLSPQECKIHYQVSGWSLLAGMTLSEVTLTYRIVAVWKRDFRAIFVLFALWMACTAAVCVFFSRFLETMQFITIPGFGIRGCFVFAADLSVVYGAWVAFMVYNTGAFIMVMIPGLKARRYSGSGRSDLMNAVYRDGAMYYALIFLISLVNVIVIKEAPPDLAFVVSSPMRVLHAILTSRAVLRIRRAATGLSISRFHDSENVPMSILSSIPRTVPDTELQVSKDGSNS